MSLVPLFAELTYNPNSGIEQLLLKDNSDVDVHPINALRRGRRHRVRYTPYKPSLRNARVKDEKNSSNIPAIQMFMDMPEFKFNELSVKVVDQTFAIGGKHKERGDDHDFIQKQVAQGL
ncbi:heat shock protein 27-like [Glossina fuscipes]|uniref:Heat shock protein 27-like n=1 Tax=Glossina fuscipes TaxID=7396 RepID=A0A9C6DVZ9_9MUSC|nr:heat shock protein 27-like [Glossina fuscipes]